MIQHKDQNWLKAITKKGNEHALKIDYPNYKARNKNEKLINPTNRPTSEEEEEEEGGTNSIGWEAESCSATRDSFLTLRQLTDLVARVSITADEWAKQAKASAASNSTFTIRSDGHGESDGVWEVESLVPDNMTICLFLFLFFNLLYTEILQLTRERERKQKTAVVEKKRELREKRKEVVWPQTVRECHVSCQIDNHGCRRAVVYTGSTRIMRQPRWQLWRGLTCAWEGTVRQYSYS